MSGKYKKVKRNHKKDPSGHVVLWIVAIVLSVALVALIVLSFTLRGVGLGYHPTETQPADPSEHTQPGADQPTESQPAQTLPPIQIQIPENVTIPLEQGLKIGDVGSYTGLFFEDGTDEPVSGIMMILVTNESDRTLQYAQITLTNDKGDTAQFDLSTVPPGASVVVLEKNRLPFSQGFGNARTENLVFFPEEPSLHTDKLQFQPYQGALNITNISGEDITGDIQIFYKNRAADVYYGGITYMVRIKGGLKAGQLQQLMPSHFNAGSSEILFVVIP